MSKTLCIGEHDLGIGQPPVAVAMAPEEHGNLTRWVAVCGAHLSTWWDGSDNIGFVPYMQLPGTAILKVDQEAYRVSWEDNRRSHMGQVSVPGLDITAWKVTVDDNDDDKLFIDFSVGHGASTVRVRLAQHCVIGLVKSLTTTAWENEPE